MLRALEEGKIARSRHESYMRLYEELKGLKEWEAKGKKNRKLCKQHRRSGLLRPLRRSCFITASSLRRLVADAP